VGLVEELGTFLDSESTRFTLGTNLFLNALPDEPNAAASITETPGGQPVHVLAGDLPAWENARVAVTCRSTSSATARANINDAWFQLQEITNETLSSRSWLRCSAVQSPFLMGRDAQGRTKYQVNFDCARRTTAA
jgi:hypothetical protein